MITLYRPSGYDSPRASSFAGRSVDDKPLKSINITRQIMNGLRKADNL